MDTAPVRLTAHRAHAPNCPPPTAVLWLSAHCGTSFLSRTAKLPVLPSVAVARFSHDGGFELSFSLPQVAMSPGGLGPGTPLLSVRA